MRHSFSVLNTPLDRAGARGFIQRIVRLGEILAVVACSLLFLHAAGTVEVGYTVRPSQVLLVLAVVLAAPLVVQGWSTLPLPVRVAGSTLVLVYCLAAVFNDEAVVAAVTRAAQTRSLVAVIDLLLGLAVLGLIAHMASRPKWAAGIVIALIVGAVIAAAYGVYQIPARALHLPLADVNNALNSDGVSRGYKFQGLGIFGVERLRSTFTEPRAFAAYLTTLLPLFPIVARRLSPMARWLVPLAALLVGVALVLTASSLAWAAFAASGLLGLWLFTIGQGRPVRAGIIAALLAVSVFSVGLLLADPAPLSAVTDRPASSLRVSADFRKTAWANVHHKWALRPVLGYGPGQSSIQLAAAVPPDRGGPRRSTVVLGSAQGVWSASLLDAGLLGFAAWVALLGLVLYYGARRLIREPTLPCACFFVAATVGVLSSQVSADRLDLRVWIVLGLLLVPWQRATPRRAGEQV